jgi:predicted enzyme related to lactoylglutathione lyase
MNGFNSRNDRVAWIDIPVADLARAKAFYAALLGVPIHPQEFSGFRFSVIDHHEGSGDCLVIKPEQGVSSAGIRVALLVDGRIRDATGQATTHSEEVVELIQGITPQAIRARVLDSEAVRVAHHSNAGA